MMKKTLDSAKKENEKIDALDKKTAADAKKAAKKEKVE